VSENRVYPSNGYLNRENDDNPMDGMGCTRIPDKPIVDI
jgi:hypothetical protein